MTLRDLATEAGVSVSTVSKAFKNSPEISNDTRERIFKIARQQGCFHKYYQEQYPNKVVAVICPEIKSNHYSEQVEYLQNKLAGRGIEVLIATDDFNATKQQHIISLLAEHTKVDGIIVYELRAPVPKGLEIPLVSIGTSEGIHHTDAIRGNQKKNFSTAINHLRELGHRKIAFIGEPLTQTSLEAFQQIMQNYELESDLVVTAEGRFEEAGKDGVRRLLEIGKPFTAIFCAYDYIAIGAIKELKKYGLQVPKDISVVGNNNIRTAGHLDKGLTTIDQSKEAFCDLACELLTKKIENPYYCSGTNIEISGSLIVRETTGPCNEKK
ncbi:MAG: LacI family DNA-binding transcriptional regulator [Clostridia bacterium]|nr:LacI family DNA-binding transcriptional regulator [Clostridia bacterium]